MRVSPPANSAQVLAEEIMILLLQCIEDLIADDEAMWEEQYLEI